MQRYVAPDATECDFMMRLFFYEKKDFTFKDGELEKKLAPYKDTEFYKNFECWFAVFQNYFSFGFGFNNVKRNFFAVLVIIGKGRIVYSVIKHIKRNRFFF